MKPINSKIKQKKQHQNFNGIAKNIMKLRCSAGWSQTELANKAGITSAAISQIEKGGRIPSLPVIQAVAMAFNVQVVDIIGLGEIQSDDKIRSFLANFGNIMNLNTKDQKLIKEIVNRLIKGK